MCQKIMLISLIFRFNHVFKISLDYGPTNYQHNLTRRDCIVVYCIVVYWDPTILDLLLDYMFDNKNTAETPKIPPNPTTKTVAGVFNTTSFDPSQFEGIVKAILLRVIFTDD